MVEFLESHSLHVGLALLFLTGLIRDYFLRRHQSAAADSVARASVALVEPLRSQITLLDARTTRCEERLLRMENANERLFAGIGILLTQIRMSGGKPLWIPDDSDRIVVTRGRHIEYQ